MITVEAAAPPVSPAYDTGLTAEEVSDRSWRRLEHVYGVRIGRAGSSGLDEQFSPQ